MPTPLGVILTRLHLHKVRPVTAAASPAHDRDIHGPGRASKRSCRLDASFERGCIGGWPLEANAADDVPAAIEIELSEIGR